MRALVLLLLIASVSLGSARQDSNLRQWLEYKRQHGKVYAHKAEDARRFSLFLATKDQIEAHNANSSHSYKLGLNHLSDWTPDERARLNGFLGGRQQQSLKQADDSYLRSILDDSSPVPDEVDWRKVPNRVTPIKDQGRCGSCWAFATTGSLEGQQVVRNFTKELIPLSEQELVDCSVRNYGCNGGWFADAMADIAFAGGIESEKNYPYKISNLVRCHMDESKFIMTDSGHIDLPENDEETMKKVVAKFGPIPVAMDAGERFYNYKSGVYSDPDCGTSLDHAVLIVGYGTDPKDGDFWILKNSWNEGWGERGFFRLKRNVNECGVSLKPSIPKFN